MWCKSRIDAYCRVRPGKDKAKAPLAFALAAAAMLSACSDIYYDRRETVALGADDHIASNRVAQMIDPWPHYVGNKNLAFDGNRMQLAADRYRRGCVIQPTPVATSALVLQQQQQQAVAAECRAAITSQTSSSLQATPSGSQWSSQTTTQAAPVASAK